MNAATGKVALHSSQTQSITFMDSSLYKAAAEGQINTFRQYAEEHHLDDLLLRLVIPNKNTVLHINIAAQSERVLKSSEFVEEILNLCPPLRLQTNIKDETPLHIAAMHGDVAVVKLLIETTKAHHKGPESGIGAVRQMLLMLTKEKDTALHEAVRNNHFGVVQLLIKEDPDFSYAANDAGETPLYLAAERGFGNLVSEILRTCTSAAYGGPNGRTALHAAVVCSDEEMTREILVKHSKRTLTKEADQQGWIPLHYAALSGHISIVKQLLEFDKSAAYIADKKEKKTALHIAADKGHIDVMKELLSSCPDCCELVNNRGRNALHYSVESQCQLAVELILNDYTFCNLIKEKDVQGNTPLHLLAASLSLIPSFICHPKVDPMAFNKQNQSAVDIALANDKFGEVKKSVVQCLEEAGSIPDRRIINPEDDGREGKNNCDNNSKPDHTEGVEDIIKMFKEGKDPHLVVAVLIATVTFAAGFTMPGGYISGRGHNQGQALLTSSSAFKAFVITNTIALVLSSSAVLIHLSVSLKSKTDQNVLLMFKFQFYCTAFAMVAMMVAFTTATYAVLAKSSGLAIATCVICSIFSTGHMVGVFFEYYKYVRFLDTTPYPPGDGEHVSEIRSEDRRSD